MILLDHVGPTAEVVAAISSDNHLETTLLKPAECGRVFNEQLRAGDKIERRIAAELLKIDLAIIGELSIEIVVNKDCRDVAFGQGRALMEVKRGEINARQSFCDSMNIQSPRGRIITEKNPAKELVRMNELGRMFIDELFAIPCASGSLIQRHRLLCSGCGTLLNNPLIRDTHAWPAGEVLA